MELFIGGTVIGAGIMVGFLLMKLAWRILQAVWDVYSGICDAFVLLISPIFEGPLNWIGEAVPQSWQKVWWFLFADGIRRGRNGELIQATESNRPAR